jgi:hypothetical protein
MSKTLEKWPLANSANLGAAPWLILMRSPCPLPASVAGGDIG